MREMLIRNCQLLQALCGQFVDRIYSTAQITADSDVKKPQNPTKLVVATTFEMAKT